MPDRPILFSGPMVRAILEGRKTQTRRILKLANRLPEYIGPRGCTDDPSCWGWSDDDRGDHWLVKRGESDKGCLDWSDWAGAYQVGDSLWVRESWNMSSLGWNRPQAGLGKLHYRATDEGQWKNYWGAWRPSIRMPRWASRLTLTVTDVRVQRLQDISEDDAWAEGCVKGDPDHVGGFFPAEEPDPSGIGHRGWDNARDWFADLWDGLNEARGYGWDANPWVCAVTFTAHQRNIDQMEAPNA